MISTLSQELFRAGAVQFGQFTLRDGRLSPFYIDLRLLVGYPLVLRDVARAMLHRSLVLRYDRLAGLPYAGLPIAVAMSLEGNVPLLYPRREAKGHGTQRQIEGVCPPGDRVLVIDDVITSGGAKVEAAASLRAAGLVVEDVLVLVDRSADASASLQSAGLNLHSVMRIEELFRELRDSGLISAEQFTAASSFVASQPG